MGIILERKLMKIIRKKIKEFNKKMMKKDKKGSFSLSHREVQHSIKYIFKYNRKNIRLSNIYFKLDFSVAYTGIVYFAYLSLAFYQDDKMNNPLPEKNNEVDGNLVISNLLVQFTNHSLSIVKLIEHGLDSSSRPLLRVLFELASTILVLLKDEMLLTEYCKGNDEKAASKFWDKNFSRGKLARLLSNLELDMGLDQDLVNELGNWRIGAFKDYSASVHSSYHASMLGAYSFSFCEDTMGSGLAGKTTAASNRVIKDLNWLLFYMSALLFPILIKIHDFKPKIENELWRITIPIRESFLEIFQYYLKLKGSNDTQ
jgi:hypothetical protein